MSRVFSIVLSKLLLILNFIFHSLSEINSLSRLQLCFLKNKTKQNTFILKAVVPAREFSCLYFGVLRRKSRSVTLNENVGESLCQKCSLLTLLARGYSEHCFQAGLPHQHRGEITKGAYSSPECVGKMYPLH